MNFPVVCVCFCRHSRERGNDGLERMSRATIYEYPRTSATPTITYDHHQPSHS
ncbi:hypothetical protein [Lysobacter gummosus]|uniref:hypothetical protein n=1 Tax=Lysobacter gummosus TaxID=262324 RepID=UPI003624F2E9